MRDLQAEFSLAYVRAVAHAAGYFVQESNRPLDADGVDLTLFSRGAGGTVRSPRLDLQVKCTTGEPVGNPFPHDLEAKNHNELVDTSWQVPRILVVVVVPVDEAAWVEADEERLLLRRCGYWLSLRGQAPTSNSRSQRVFLPRAQLFHVQPLRDLMERVRKGGHP